MSFDVMQRVTNSRKKIGTANCEAFNKTYDSGGRVVSITYPEGKIYSYEYDVAGNLLYIKKNNLWGRTFRIHFRCGPLFFPLFTPLAS